MKVKDSSEFRVCISYNVESKKTIGKEHGRSQVRLILDQVGIGKQCTVFCAGCFSLTEHFLPLATEPAGGLSDCFHIYRDVSKGVFVLEVFELDMVPSSISSESSYEGHN